MKPQLTLALTIFAVSTFTVSCGGGDLDNKTESTVTGPAGVASISGLYAWNNTNGDEGYTNFSADGSVSDYDYAGDSFDNQGNCYWVDENSETLTHISGNLFLIEDNFDGSTAQITIVPTSLGINVTGPGGSSTLLNTNLSISAFTPECSNVTDRPIEPKQALK